MAHRVYILESLYFIFQRYALCPLLSALVNTYLVCGERSPAAKRAIRPKLSDCRGCRPGEIGFAFHWAGSYSK
jgi:hypothetical protein